ncbi:glycosyltransferase [Geoalkalibacter sp.]|uniref:glycosyltransferase n=1 Tax=Geoalkalibacter sp. TaxID=3041440 RepID=UPI00272E7CE0|nr:glycosyltransferase [Geoalkalibacter sp.]
MGEKLIHVLHVVPGLLAGGMETTMARVIAGLNGQGFRHSIACLKSEPEIADRIPDDVDIHLFHARPNEPQLPFRLAALIRDIRPDVIHARNWGAWPDVAVGRLLARPLVPLIYSFHGLGVAGYMPWRRRAASKVLVRMTTHLFTVSRQSRDLMVAHWGWPAERTQVIANGVDTGRFFPAPKPRGERLVVGSVGNLRTVKNHRLILDACRPLIAEGLDLEIRIAGEGDQREALTSHAAALGIGERLALWGRVEDIPGFLNDLDVFVLSSDSEQHPNALNEAMACAIPSIATRVGCVEDLLDGGRCGAIVEPGDVAGLTQALRDYLVDPDLRRAFGERSLAHVREHYSLAVMLERYGEMYKAVARPRE